MASAHLCSSLYLSVPEACATTRLASRTSATPTLPLPKSTRFGTAFATGSPVLRWRSSPQRKHACKATPVSIRCEQGSQEGSGLDTWLGRFAMVGFASAITVEVATGKGLLENFGLTSPLPTVALAVTALVGVLTAIFIFQSAAKN